MKGIACINDCDLLWISDVLELKQNDQNKFSSTFKKNISTVSFSVVNVTIFGTIVEIRQIGNNVYVYHIDDGTGVIGCKVNKEQFEQIICTIENEQSEILNQTYQASQLPEQSICPDISSDDSIFNDRSIQKDEFDLLKNNELSALKSMWNDIYDTYSNLLGNYQIGDVVLVKGKLYTYFNANQIYVNFIRPLSFQEEILRVSIKLEDGFDQAKLENDKRFSGLMTFDHIHHLSADFPPIRNIDSTFPEDKILQKEDKPKVVTPQLKSTITFDTFSN